VAEVAEVAENSFCAIYAIYAMLFFSSFTPNPIRGLLKSLVVLVYS
jgi:hypothetical protein